MVESAEKQRERRMKRRREAEARGEELRGRGRPKAAVGLVVQDAGRRSSQLELDAKVAAGLKLEYGGALRAAESVAEARVMLRAHADKLAEMAYDYWLDARGVVHQRLVPAQRLLLRTAHVNNLSALARKVHNHSGRQMRCLSFKPVTGGNVKVGLLAELLRVVQSYVVRGILVELRYVMLNGLCGAACADGDGASVRPLCAALEGLSKVRCQKDGCTSLIPYSKLEEHLRHRACSRGALSRVRVRRPGALFGAVDVGARGNGILEEVSGGRKRFRDAATRSMVQLCRVRGGVGRRQHKCRW
jgi:uncharacterized protein YcfL